MSTPSRIAKLAGVAGAIAMPMFFRTRGPLGPTSRWILHSLFLILVALGLGFIQYQFDLDRHVERPREAFRNLWLPLLFLLAYALCWLGRGLWGLIGLEGEATVAFPDIDRAWSEAVRALDASGIDLTSTPLFLVLGRTRATEDALFRGIQPRLVMSGLPAGADAPLRVYANRDGIYVTLPGASLLGLQSGLLADESFEAPPPEARDEKIYDSMLSFSTINPAEHDSAAAIQQIMARAREQGRGGGQLLEEERRAIGLMVAAGGTDEHHASVASNEGQARAPRSAVADRADSEIQISRLRAACRIIARDRSPFCPINGVLVLLPIASSQSDEAATRIGQVARVDLEAVRDAMEVRCPVFALVCDLETLPGFRELTARLPQDQRDRRMGQRYPLIPDAEPSALPGMIGAGIQQIGNVIIPNLVSTLWRVESTGSDSAEDAIRGNTELYRLLGGIRDRQARLIRVLTRAMLPVDSTPMMFGGCYLAATGSDSSGEQAFIPGVFRRLVESQDYVSWSPEAVAHDQSYARWTRVGYVGAVLVAIAGLLVIGFRILA